MAQGLIFYYGTMGCSKSANALMTRFQYVEKGKNVWLIKPSTDDRDDIITAEGYRYALIKSRIGIQATADILEENSDIITWFTKRNNERPIDIIICDEVQFLTPIQIENLKEISDTYNINILCYGLRTDFKTKLFPGSKRLFELADEIHEIDSICECGNHAIVNARINAKGEIVEHGSQVEIGGDDRYKPLCWHCYKEKLKKGNN